MTPGVTLDTGALIAYEKQVRVVVALLKRIREVRGTVVVPAGALAQAWRDGRKQARLARLLATDELEVEPLDDFRARAAGQLCGVTATKDIVDASVVLCARRRKQPIITSDPEDLRRLDPDVDLIVV